MKSLMTITALVFANPCTQMNGPVSTTPVQLTPQQLGQIEAVVANDFYDRDHALFRNVRAVNVATSAGAEIRVCGEVAGVNAVGGYGSYAFFGGTIFRGVYLDADYPQRCE